MFHISKQRGRLVHFFNFLLLKYQRHTNLIRPYSYFVNYYSQIALNSSGQNKGFLVRNDQSRLIVSRGKHGSSKKKPGKPKDEESSDEDTDEEDDDDDDEVDQYTENGNLFTVKQYRVKSLRIDVVLKTVLRRARKNVEKNFYENRIRMNGRKVQKKSINVNVNHVIDVIKGAGDDPGRVIVEQVKIQKIQPEGDRFFIRAAVCKSIEVENYNGADAWRQLQQDEDSF